MNLERLNDLLAQMASLTVCVFGDVVYERFLDLDPDVAPSVPEAKAPAYQVATIRGEASGAGGVVNNLCSLGVGAVRLISIIGVDGEGYELANLLAKVGVETSGMLQSTALLTPTLTHARLRHPDGAPEEISRFEVRNHRLLPKEARDEMLRELRGNLPEASGIVIVDDAIETDCGVISDALLEPFSELATTRPETFFLAQSRTRTGQFRNLITRTSLGECRAALGRKNSADPPEALAAALRHRTGASLYMTLDDHGMLVSDGEVTEIVPGYPPEEATAATGAGDAATAALIAALAGGATPTEAAAFANLAAAVTAEQVGFRGHATPKQMRRRFHADVENK